MYLSISLTTAFIREEVSLMGRKSFGDLYSHLPDFDLKNTLLPSHTCGIMLSVKLALVILQRSPMIRSSASCSSIRYILSSSGDLYGLKYSIAYLILKGEAI